jgi:uncharacterized protein (TIGR03663 family)
MRTLRTFVPRRPDRLTLIVLAIVAVALVLRVIDLGARAMHHDESLHATFSWYLSEGRGYEHNPLMHGPLLFHVTAAAFKVFGDNEFVSRLPMALAGTALVATPLLLRRWLGAVGVITAAAALTISPSLLYFSRFARNDILVALFTALIVISIWRYREDGRLRWLLVIGASLALSFAAKESSYITAAALLLYLNATLTASLLTTRADGVSSRRHALEVALLFPVAWAVAALWPLLDGAARRLRFPSRLPREGELLIVIGTLVAPLLAAFSLPIAEALSLEVTPDRERTFGVLITLALLNATLGVGLLWNWRRWLLVAALFYAITLPLFTTFGTNPEGIAGPFWTSLDYWLEQQEVRRGAQPWFYYFMMVPLYELFLLVPAALLGIWLAWRRDPLTLLFAWWFIATFAALSYAGEKMPWLTVHLALPLVFLAARGLGLALPRAWEWFSSPRASAFGWAAGGIGGAVATLLLLMAGYTSLGLSFDHSDTAIEPLIYTQTTPQVPVLSERIFAELEAGSASSVVVDTSSSLSWPWAWYLRDAVVNYLPPETIRAGEFDQGAILVVERSTLPPGSELRSRYTVVEPYQHRWWFPEEGYRATSISSLADDLVEGSLLDRWLTFLLERVDESSLGSLNGEVFFPQPS